MSIVVIATDIQLLGGGSMRLLGNHQLRSRKCRNTKAAKKYIIGPREKGNGRPEGEK